MTAAAPTTVGTAEAVPCPWCKKANEFEGDDELLESGEVVPCDHCKKNMKIVSVLRTVRIALERA